MLSDRNGSAIFVVVSGSPCAHKLQSVGSIHRIVLKIRQVSFGNIMVVVIATMYKLSSQYSTEMPVKRERLVSLNPLS